MNILHTPIKRTRYVIQFYDILKDYSGRDNIITNIVDHSSEIVCNYVYKKAVKQTYTDIYLIILNKYPQFADIIVY